MKKNLSQIEWRPDLFEKPIVEIYISSEHCRDAGIYKQSDGKLIYQKAERIPQFL